MAAWQALVCLSVLAFLLRAIIPVGYMPGSSGERKTPFAITLCSASGPTFIQVGLSTQSELPHPDSSFNGDICPFSLNGVQELLPGHWVPPLAIATLQAFVPVLRKQAQPAMSPVGPPLGSRAPPLLFGWRLA